MDDAGNQTTTLEGRHYDDSYGSDEESGQSHRQKLNQGSLLQSVALTKLV